MLARDESKWIVQRAATTEGQHEASGLTRSARSVGGTRLERQSHILYRSTLTLDDIAASAMVAGPLLVAVVLAAIRAGAAQVANSTIQDVLNGYMVQPEVVPTR